MVCAGNYQTELVLRVRRASRDADEETTADNFCSSIPLAHKLLEHDVYYLEKTKKLKEGELIVRQDEYGVTVLKWKDHHELYVMIIRAYVSTAQLNIQMLYISSYLKGAVNNANKPLIYNKSRSFVDLSTALYSSTDDPCIRRTSRVFAVVLLFDHPTAVVNSWYIYSLGCDIERTDIHTYNAETSTAHSHLT
ncbi:hypothetical protein OSTOST_21579 [Ostertagia ostertagi]